MFASIRGRLAERKHRRALETQVRAYSAELRQLREGLVMNLMQDVFYEDFPHLPSRTTKERREFGLYSVKILTDLTGLRSRVCLVVRRGDAFVGSLTTDTREDWVAVTLPRKALLQEEMQDLVAALLLIETRDQSQRTRAA